MQSQLFGTSIQCTPNPHSSKMVVQHLCVISIAYLFTRALSSALRICPNLCFCGDAHTMLHSFTYLPQRRLRRRIPEVTGQWRGRGAGMARAWRGGGAGVARAWRGRGAGIHSGACGGALLHLHPAAPTVQRCSQITPTQPVWHLRQMEKRYCSPKKMVQGGGHRIGSPPHCWPAATDCHI
eukprot:gene22234-biopygen2720